MRSCENLQHLFDDVLTASLIVNSLSVEPPMSAFFNSIVHDCNFRRPFTTHTYHIIRNDIIVVLFIPNARWEAIKTAIKLSSSLHTPVCSFPSFSL